MHVLVLADEDVCFKKFEKYLKNNFLINIQKFI